VGGTFIIQFVDETTGIAALSGDLSGAVRGVIEESSVADDGTMTMQLAHTIVTSSGDLLLTTDAATLTPVTGTLFLMQQTQTLVGGSGTYANVTGTLEEFGAVDFGTGQGVLRYSGEICTGN
jgi:large exoprotein involved in heme utilization and adhesion